MTTAISLITDALTELGIAGNGSAVQAEDAALGLRKLNQLLQRWANSRLTFPVLTEISVPTTGAASYTIGPSGAVVAARPLKIDRVTAIDANGVEYDVRVLSRALWDGIAVKDVDGGPPSHVWYDAQATNGRLYVYPQSSGYTLKLDCQTLFTSFELTSTDVTLPEGYESAIYLNLADDLAASYGKQTSPDTRRRAAGAMRVIKRTNTEPLTLEIDGSTPGPFEIERGY